MIQQEGDRSNASICKDCSANRYTGCTLRITSDTSTTSQAQTQYQASRPSVGRESASSVTHNDGDASLSNITNTSKFSKRRRESKSALQSSTTNKEKSPWCTCPADARTKIIAPRAPPRTTCSSPQLAAMITASEKADPSGQKHAESGSALLAFMDMYADQRVLSP